MFCLGKNTSYFPCIWWKKTLPHEEFKENVMFILCLYPNACIFFKTITIFIIHCKYPVLVNFSLFYLVYPVNYTNMTCWQMISIIICNFLCSRFYNFILYYLVYPVNDTNMTCWQMMLIIICNFSWSWLYIFVNIILSLYCLGLVLSNV